MAKFRHSGRGESLGPVDEFVERQGSRVKLEATVSPGLVDNLYSRGQGLHNTDSVGQTAQDGSLDVDIDPGAPRSA